jgi:hypothetical protein
MFAVSVTKEWRLKMSLKNRISHRSFGTARWDREHSIAGLFCERSEVFTAVTVKNAVSWDVNSVWLL